MNLFEDGGGSEGLMEKNNMFSLLSKDKRGRRTGNNLITVAFMGNYGVHYEKHCYKQHQWFETEATNHLS